MASLIGKATTTVRNRTRVPLVTPRRGLFSKIAHSSTRGLENQMRAYGELGILHSVVDRICEATSTSEWELYRKAPSGDPDDRTVVEDHLAKRIWMRPNPFMASESFVEVFMNHRELTGEIWWLVSRDPRASFPMELWPIRPDRIEPVPHPTEYISGYIYHGPDDEDVPLEVNEIIYDHKPNPLDPLRGMAPIQSVMTDAESARYSSQWIRSFFYNSAEPGGIIEVDKRLGDDEFRELRDRWDEQHRGVSRAHRVAILEQGKWVDRKFTMREMQMSDLRTDNREVVREAYGFPKPLLGTVEDVNRANAEAAEVLFTRWIQVIRLKRIRSLLNNFYLPMFGSAANNLEWDYKNPVPVNVELQSKERESKARGANWLIGAGYAPDDVTDAMELPNMRWVGPPQPLDPGGRADHTEETEPNTGTE